MENPYENFKNGIKKDIEGIGYSLWGMAGLLLIFLVIIIGTFFVYGPKNTASDFTKILVGVLLIVFTVFFISNKRFSNTLMTISMNIVIVLIGLVFLAFCGLIVYAGLKLAYSE